MNDVQLSHEVIEMDMYSVRMPVRVVLSGRDLRTNEQFTKVGMSH